MARNGQETPRGRRARSLSLRGILLLLLVLGAVVVMERFDVLPPGTLDALLGEEKNPPRERSAVRPSAPAPSPIPTPAPARPPAAARDGPIDYAQAQILLDGIRVEPEMRRGYHREDWPHWIDADRNCLNTREEVLIRDAARPPRLSTNGCTIQSGTWFDPYTGETLHDTRKIDIDHRVPLEETYGSGGYEWDRAKREAYANDLSDPLTLVAVTAAANRAKGAKGPEEWLPPRREGVCLYVADWIAVKARWALSMDERERVTVGNLLADCRSQVAEHGPAGATP